MASLILGIHVSKKSKFLKDKKEAKDISASIDAEMNYLGLNAAQIFVAGPQGLVPARINYDKVKEVCHDIDLAVHSAYPTIGIWKVNNDNKSDAKSKRILGAFKAQMQSCKKIGAHSFVLHIAKQYPEDIAETMSILKPIAKKTGVKIVLEMVASKSDALKTYETPEKLNNLITKIGSNETWWGICVDTAHVWAAGCNEVKSYSDMKHWLDRIVFKKKITMFHLNGAMNALGSGKDKHAIAFSAGDAIWYGVKPEESGVKAVIEFAISNTIPLICEINIDNEKEAINSLTTIKKLAI